MREQLDLIIEQASAEAGQSRELDQLDLVRVKYLGKKGRLTALLKSVGGLPPEERPAFGQAVNKARRAFEDLLDRRKAELQTEAYASAERLDVTLPGRATYAGRLHPITQTMNEVIDIFARLGFEVRTGPEVETDYYNFEALNFPKDHPARDMQDTFFLDQDIVLRTHTSPVQVRTMESMRPPVRMICLGRTFRRDSDATHSPMFHQCEGLLVDKGVTLADLKGVLTFFVKEMFGSEVPVRFRPSFFPFTEPSVEVDMGCVMCGGQGCRVCSHSGWIEILGSGMVDPNVFGFVDYDPEVYSGFAWGMGIERMCMIKHGIGDLRLFFDNDLRFLSQF